MYGVEGVRTGIALRTGRVLYGPPPLGDRHDLRAQKRPRPREFWWLWGKTAVYGSVKAVEIFLFSIGAIDDRERPTDGNPRAMRSDGVQECERDKSRRIATARDIAALRGSRKTARLGQQAGRMGNVEERYRSRISVYLSSFTSYSASMTSSPPASSASPQPQASPPSGPPAAPAAACSAAVAS